MRRLLSLTLAGVGLFAPAVYAQLPGLVSTPLAGGGQSWSLPVQTLVFITSLTFIPAILLMMTSFTRIIIVFGLLRNALGTPSAPPNQVLLGLALFLTFFIMSPVIDKIYTDAYQPFSEDKISMQEALDKGAQPLREFMLRQTREADGPLCPPVQHRRAAGTGSGTHAYSAARLCDQRAENRIPDWLYHLYSVPDYRPGDRQRPDGARDDDGTARDHRPAL